jgi:hypothetical protein
MTNNDYKWIGGILDKNGSVYVLNDVLETLELEADMQTYNTDVIYWEYLVD